MSAPLMTGEFRGTAGKWQPGPWSAHCNDVRPSEGDDGKRFWDIYSGEIFKFPCDQYLSGYVACPVEGGRHVASVQFGNAEASAHLIAAAPDMIAVLRDLFENPQYQVAIGGNPNMVDDLMTRARAAIARAVGDGE